MTRRYWRLEDAQRSMRVQRRTPSAAPPEDTCS